MNPLIFSRLQRIVARLFSLPVAQVSPQTSSDTIDAWDSLNHLNLVLALEQEFGVRFAPEEFEQMLSVERIGALLDAKLHVRGIS